ncbi:MAG TPA: protoporphyrinogen oxidase [Blastocatellia bacterium]|nr:protoporphyrinogen oxidase [Blastocatellia bacterium]
MPQNHKDVVVIGAGISGLVCAYRLKALGVDVALLEKSSRVGGVIQTERVGGFLIERGPNSSQGTEELIALVEELGITADLTEGDPKAPAYVYFNGKLHPVPSGAGPFIKSRLLSFAGKLRIFKDPFVPVRRADSEESVAAFARRRIGREAADLLVAPFVSGIYAGDAERLSVQAAFPKLANLETGYGGLIRGAFAKAREARRARKSASAVLDKAAPTRRRLCSFKKGMAFLPNTIAAMLGEDLITECEELRIADCGLRIDESSPRQATESPQSALRNPQSIQFSIDYERKGDHHQFTCDKLIVATPATGASWLLASVSNELSGLLGEIEYPPLAIVSLAYDESAVATPLDGFGFLVPPSERMNVLGCVWNSSLFEDRAPKGKALVTLFIGGARNPAGASLADDDLVSTAHRELQQVLGISGEPQVVAITRYERSIPQYNLGHFSRVQRIESLLRELPGLRIIGNYLHGVSTGDCIKEADRVAREVRDSIGPR